MSAGTRLWGGSLSVALAVHLAVGAAAILWLAPPVSDLPAGAFAVELAEFGGAKGAQSAAGAASRPPSAPPQVAEVKPPPPPPPKPEAEVALPKPKPMPMQKPVAKPAPKPEPAPRHPPKPVAETKAAPSSPGPAGPVPSGGASSQAASAPTEGAAGSPISGRLGAGGTDAGTPLGRYKALVYHALWQKRSYPAVAQRMGYQGEVEVAFTIAASGEISGVRVTRESGYGALDREAAALLARVRQFPAFPADLAAQNLTFRIVIPFKLS